MELDNGNGQPLENPAWLALTPEGINQNDVVTSEIDSLWLPTVGAFTGDPVAGLKETVLLHSSKQAELTDDTPARNSSLLGDDFAQKPIDRAFSIYHPPRV